MILMKAVNKKAKIKYKCEKCCSILLEHVNNCVKCNSVEIRPIEIYLQK